MEKLAAGMSVNEVSKITGLSYNTIYSIKSRMGKKYQGYSINHPEKIEAPLGKLASLAFIEDATKGMSDAELAQEYDMTEAQVKALKRKEGLVTPPMIDDVDEADEQEI